MRIFVTGGSGYIGRAVVAELLRRGHHVAALARSDAAAATVRALGAAGGARFARFARRHRVGDARTRRDDSLRLAVPPDGVAREAKVLDVLLARRAERSHARLHQRCVGVRRPRRRGRRRRCAGHADRARGVAPGARRARAGRACARRFAPSSSGRPSFTATAAGSSAWLVAQAKPGPREIVGDGTNRWSTVRVDALAELYAAAVEQPAANGIYNAINGAPVPYVEIARAASRAGGGNGTIEHLTFENAQARHGSVRRSAGARSASHERQSAPRTRLEPAPPDGARRTRQHRRTVTDEASSHRTASTTGASSTCASTPSRRAAARTNSRSSSTAARSSSSRSRRPTRSCWCASTVTPSAKTRGKSAPAESTRARRPKQAAVRELREETGYRARTVRRLWSAYSAPGFCNELLHFFHTDAYDAGEPEPDAEEEIEIATFPLDRVREMIERDELRDAKTQVAVLWALGELNLG